jgi:hypothetical protein
MHTGYGSENLTGSVDLGDVLTDRRIVVKEP